MLKENSPITYPKGFSSQMNAPCVGEGRHNPFLGTQNARCQGRGRPNLSTEKQYECVALIEWYHRNLEFWVVAVEMLIFHTIAWRLVAAYADFSPSSKLFWCGWRGNKKNHDILPFAQSHQIEICPARSAQWLEPFAAQVPTLRLHAHTSLSRTQSLHRFLSWSCQQCQQSQGFLNPVSQVQILLEAGKRQMALVQEAAQGVLNVWTSTWAFALICLWDVLYGILIILVWNGSGFLNTLLTIQDFVVNTQNTKNRIQSYTYTYTQSQLKPCCSLYFNDTCRERTLQDCAQRQFFVPPKLTCHGGQAAALGLDFACPSCPNRKCGKSSQWDIPREIVWSHRLRQWSESFVPGGHFKAPSASRASWEACSNCHVLLTCSVLRSNKDEPRSAII